MPSATDPTLIVIQLRINSDGAGEGKLSLGGKIGPHKATGVALRGLRESAKSADRDDAPS